MNERKTTYAPLGARLNIFVFTVWVPLLIATIIAGRFWVFAFGGTFVVFLIAALRTCMSFDRTDLIVRNLFVTRRFKWSEVERLEPSANRIADQLVAVVRGRRQRLLITIGPGTRGEDLPAALRSALGAGNAERVIAFRPPANSRWWSRRRSSWRPK